MSAPGARFHVRSAEALQDDALRKAVGTAADRFATARNEAFAAEPDLEALRDAGREIKDRALKNLPALLNRLEKNVTRNGGIVYRAADADEAVSYILSLARRHFVRLVTKSKSMTTEEIDLAAALEEEEIETIETDLGERIIQLAREKPAHIIIPAIHKTRQQVAKLFSDAFDIPECETIEELTKVARETMRRKFLTADMGITGGNFLIAETGTLVIVENEGNVRLCTTLPRIHVAVVGIEKVIENLSDLPTMLRLLTRSATGQQISTYVSLLSGPRGAQEVDGAEEFHLILLDNGRSGIHQDEEMREVLACIRCGACLNVCPVYKRVGGHAYGWVYPGPIGSVITPLLKGHNDGEGRDLPFASSLCGACKEVCPVKIDLPRLLLRLRARYAPQEGGLLQAFAFKAWAFAFGSPRRLALARRMGRRLQRLAGQRLPYPITGWTRSRALPRLAETTFRQWWEKRRGGV